MREEQYPYFNLSNRNVLASRGGQDLPARSAARFISRIATIWRACDLLSSRRLALPPIEPMYARYSCTCFSVLLVALVI